MEWGFTACCFRKWLNVFAVCRSERRDPSKNLGRDTQRIRGCHVELLTNTLLGYLRWNNSFSCGLVECSPQGHRGAPVGVAESGGWWAPPLHIGGSADMEKTWFFWPANRRSHQMMCSWALSPGSVETAKRSPRSGTLRGRTAIWLGRVRPNVKPYLAGGWPGLGLSPFRSVATGQATAPCTRVFKIHWISQFLQISTHRVVHLKRI